MPLLKPWFNSPKAISVGSSIVILGGGISGLMTAYHLQQKGYNITLIDKNHNLMSAASGNPVALLDPFLSLKHSTENSFYLNSYLYSVDFYKNLNKGIFNQCGLIKIPKNEMEKEHFKKIPLNYASDFLALQNDTLNFPTSGLIFPKKLAHVLSDQLTLILNTHVKKISREDNKKWVLYSSDNMPFMKADAIVICNSYDVSEFRQTQHLNLDKIFGQITYAAAQYSENSILCSDGYVSPVVMTDKGPAHIIGATFKRTFEFKITDEDHIENLNKSPLKFQPETIKGGRVGIRAVTTDHLPLSGPVANYKPYLEQYSDLHYGPNYKKFPLALYQPNLFVNVGLGARGFLSAPYIAKLLSEQITGNTPFVDHKIREAIHPARFIIRRLSKGSQS
jgi:tRNA 5-methylaminomethyl-2-thiouridine biosynthesis bifunctional protein